VSEILITSVKSFIGSHAALVLDEGGHEILLYDNPATCKASVFGRLGTVSGRRTTK